ncbi:hypothetical protein Rsub_00825 [Raphidocelis subcapitata]|uniref:Uncharacterized protein n=1 Tax=Raphidocelis subcapitata TaxID=307507 RepID=A0A2V0NRC9_9CHLO|nr:hypothetical protein Rsub_00825 [Raphidocelis subcapitata]|eukprot:GBF88113.1 hypothetical protein Rsub_00825 [Raphidocelis subcapitata]
MSQRREYRVWEAHEEQALRDGVKKHGLGAWEKIRTDLEFEVLSTRSGVQLKDKWRNLVKFRHLTQEDTQTLQPKTSGPWHRRQLAAAAGGAFDGDLGTRLVPFSRPLLRAPSVGADGAASGDQGEGPFADADPLPVRKSERSGRRRTYRDLAALSGSEAEPGEEDEEGEDDDDEAAAVLDEEGLSSGSDAEAARSRRKRRRGGDGAREDRRFGIYDRRRYNAANAALIAASAEGRRRSGGGGAAPRRRAGSVGREESTGSGAASDRTVDAAGRRPRRRGGEARRRGGGGEARGGGASGDEGAYGEDCVACPCGANADDGELMIECEACRTWAHVACLRTQMEAHEIASPIGTAPLYNMDAYLCVPCQAASAAEHAAAPLGAPAARHAGAAAGAAHLLLQHEFAAPPGLPWLPAADAAGAGYGGGLHPLHAAYPRSISPALPGFAAAATQWDADANAAAAAAAAAGAADGACGAPGGFDPAAGGFGGADSMLLRDDEDEDGMVEIDPVLLLILQGSLYCNRRGRDSPAGDSRRRSEGDPWLGGFVTGGSDDTGSSGSEGGGLFGAGLDLAAAGADGGADAPLSTPLSAPPRPQPLPLPLSPPQLQPLPLPALGRAAPGALAAADAAAPRHHPAAVLPGHPKWRPPEDPNNDAAAPATAGGAAAAVAGAAAAGGSPLGTPPQAAGGDKPRRARRRLPPGSPEYGARVAELLEQERLAASRKLLQREVESAAAAAAAAASAAAAAAARAALGADAAAVLAAALPRPPGAGAGAAQAQAGAPVLLRRVAAVRHGAGGPSNRSPAPLQEGRAPEAAGGRPAAAAPAHAARPGHRAASAPRAAPAAAALLPLTAAVAPHDARPQTPDLLSLLLAPEAWPHASLADPPGVAVSAAGPAAAEGLFAAHPAAVPPGGAGAGGGGGGGAGAVTSRAGGSFILLDELLDQQMP